MNSKKLVRQSILLQLFFIWSSLSSVAWATRILKLPPLSMTGAISYILDSTGAPCTAASCAGSAQNGGTGPFGYFVNNNNNGTALSMDINLLNLGGQDTNAIVTLTFPNISPYGRCSTPTGDRYFSSVVDLCQQKYGTVMMHATESTYGGSLVLGTVATPIIIPANNSVLVQAQLILYGPGPVTAAGPCPVGILFGFEPAIQIEIQEDKGAVLGSFTYSTPPLGLSSVQTCSGTSFNGYDWGYVPPFGQYPVFLNGGRPF